MTDFDYQQQAGEELHQRTLIALEHAKALGATEEDLRLLAFHAGVNYDRELNNAMEG